jgi:6-phosphofructokinase 1
MGYAAIEALMEGQRNVMIGIKNDAIVYVPISRAVKNNKPIDAELISVLNVLSM